MIQVRQLFDLQELDQAAAQRQSEIQKLESQLTETPELIAAKKQWDDKVSELEAKQKEHRDLDTEAEDLRAKIAPLEQKLNGGTIKNAKELVNMKADLDQQKAALAQKDDRLIDIMEAMEKLRAQGEKKQKDFEEVQKRWQEEKGKALGRLDSEKAVLADLEQKKQALASRLDPESVSLYNALKARKGRAVARVQQGMCQGCRVTLPMTLIQRARASKNEAVFCCNCERILLVG